MVSISVSSAERNRSECAPVQFAENSHLKFGEDQRLKPSRFERIYDMAEAISGYESCVFNSLNRATLLRLFEHDEIPV